ncbi:MAG: hypothetical protein ACYC4L_22335 [Chloroflexota bacterium]
MVVDGSIGGTSPWGRSHQVGDQLAPAELQAVTSWVQDGGSLLVVARRLGRAAEANLPALLAPLGLELDWAKELHRPAVTAQGKLDSQGYAVALPEGWSWPVMGGEPVLGLEGQALGAVASRGRGKADFIGNGQFFGMPSSPAFGRPGLGAVYQLDNAAFVIDSLAYLTARPLLWTAERQHVAWEARLLAAEAAVAQGR